ncbi:DUF559 domain-containing protein [soil metagenome]
MGVVRALFDLMAAQHGVATTRQARAVGVSARVERRLQADGTLWSPFPAVLAAGGAPVTFEARALAAAWSPGVVAVSHASAARLHGLDGFDGAGRVPDAAPIDVIGQRHATLHRSLGARPHYTRGPIDRSITNLGPIPVLNVPATLALLAPEVGIGPTARALDSALRMGVTADELRATAEAWRQRGRSGPPGLLMLLGERVDQRLPRSWFQRIASRVLSQAGIRLVDEYPVRDERGVLLAELDLADPQRRVGVECQSWQWHATPAAQHRDARRRGTLRQLGWEVVDVWWSDLRAPERVVAELMYVLRARTPRPA